MPLFSPARARTRVLALLAALVAAVVAYVFFSGRRRPRVGPSPKTKTAKTHVVKGSPPVRPDRKKGPLKGPVPQKIDLFVAEATRQNPALIEEEVRRLFPRKFEVHGHVVVVRMNPDVTLEEFQPLAKAFATSFAPIEIHVVLHDGHGIVGELRRPELTVLYEKDRADMSHLRDIPRILTKRWCESRAKELSTFVPEADLQWLIQNYTQSPTYAIHIENGVRYGFDVNRVMFSSGNTTERMHFAAIDAKDEVVVDMFVGIGYFTLPLAMHCGVAVIHALDKNPDSVAFVRLNAVHNRVDHLIKAQCGDNREVGSELGGLCNRVLMGLIPSCKEFLPRALFFLRKDEAGRPNGVIHYHFLADKAVARQVVMGDVREELGEGVLEGMSISALRCVKSYAPKQFHFVADLTFA